MHRTSAVLLLLLLLVALGCGSGDDHPAIAPATNTAPATTTAPVVATRSRRPKIASYEAAWAVVTKFRKFSTPGLPFMLPQSVWEAQIRDGGAPIVVGVTGKVFVVPFFQTSPGVWAYVVQEDGVFSLPIFGDTMPVVSRERARFRDGRQMTLSSVGIRSTTGQRSVIAVVPWALPMPGETLESTLEIFMSDEIRAVGVTLDTVDHRLVGGVPGLLATAHGKVNGIECQAMIWRIYLPTSKRVIGYSVYSPNPGDLRMAGAMMRDLFEVWDR